MTETAYFVNFPRTESDLFVPHPLEQEQPYEIVKIISLSAMDYENFCTDMIADRFFLEENSDLCGESPVWRCLLVQQRGRSDGILVLPDHCYVKWAAYRPGSIPPGRKLVFDSL